MNKSTHKFHSVQGQNSDKRVLLVVERLIVVFHIFPMSFSDTEHQYHDDDYANQECFVPLANPNMLKRGVNHVINKKIQSKPSQTKQSSHSL